MICQQCHVNKLYKEFPQEPLTEQCNHPPMVCMRCVIAFVKENEKCPIQDCAAEAKPESAEIGDMELRLEYLFSSVSLNREDEASPATGSDGPRELFFVSTLTGENIPLDYESSMTITDLKIKIEDKTGYEVVKQKLVFRGNDLSVRNADGTMARLSDYDVQPEHTIHLITRMYAIPEKFNHVKFDLSWGYPDTGKDALDASCFAFAGEDLLFIADYRNKKHGAVWHSGDEMDDAKKVGHHVINVKLKELPGSLTHLFFTLSAWGSEKISKYPNPTLKFYEASKPREHLCSTTIASDALRSRAVIMCFASHSGGVWEIFNSGKSSDGFAENYAPLVATVQSIIEQGV